MPEQPPPARDGSSTSPNRRAGPSYVSGLSRDPSPGSTPDRQRPPHQRTRPSPSVFRRAQGPGDDGPPVPSALRRGQRAAADPPAPRPMPAGQVLLAGVVALALAAFLNADALVRDAERKEFGTGRDVSLAVWEPVQTVSNALGLSEPRRVADEALGRDVGPPAVLVLPLSPGTQVVGETAPGPTVSSAPGGVAAPESGSTGTNASSSEAPNSTTITTTTRPPTTTTSAPRAPTAEEPLVLWVGGDSMAQVFGESLVRLGSETGVISPVLNYQISTGLTRPDFFNWPARLTDVISNDDPDVMVVIFGANDAQGMELSNGVFQPFDDEWVSEYAQRVATAMDIITADSDRIVIWVGQPIMRSGSFDRRMNRLNEIYISQASVRDQILYLDTRSMFAGSNGEYEAFLPALDGETRNLRQQDGTHLSRAGGDLLADAVLDLVGTKVDLVSGRTPATTVTLPATTAP